MNEKQVLKRLENFVDERDWAQFHTVENLAKSISIESAELLELFQWSSEASKKLILDELADVLTYCFMLANKLGVSPAELILKKLSTSVKKYPVSKAKGKSTKYDRL